MASPRFIQLTVLEACEIRKDNSSCFGDVATNFRSFRGYSPLDLTRNSLIISLILQADKSSSSLNTWYINIY